MPPKLVFGNCAQQKRTLAKAAAAAAAADDDDDEKTILGSAYIPVFFLRVARESHDAFMNQRSAPFSFFYG